jgi:hypothetical protein
VRGQVGDELIGVLFAVDVGECAGIDHLAAGVHCAPPLACFAIKASMSATCQAVTDAPSLNGFGKSGLLRAQRQTVAALTGNIPVLAGLLPFAGVLASSLIRTTRIDIVNPF